jgi:enoyl-CoA hydratase
MTSRQRVLEAGTRECQLSIGRYHPCTSTRRRRSAHNLMADSPTENETTTATITLEREGHMLLMGLNRPRKRNAFTLEMPAELSRAYGLLESDDDLRVGVLFVHGEHFTGGLDLADVAPAVTSGKSPFPDEGRNPFRIDGTWRKPLVAAAHGRVITAVIRVAACS